MGRPKTFGFTLMLRTPEAKRRAKKLAQKNKGRYEVDDRVDGTFFYYIPHGKVESQAHWDDGLKILAWVERGEGTEPEP
jgi:hypothetical protein